VERLVRPGDPIDERGIDRPRGDFGDSGARIDRADRDPKKRIGGAHLPRGGGQQLRRRQGADGDPYLGGFVTELAELAAGDVEAEQDASRVLGQALPGRCGADRAALDELVAELEFQGRHLLGDRRLSRISIG
jgi:hypothetical protein